MLTLWGEKIMLSHCNNVFFGFTWFSVVSGVCMVFVRGKGVVCFGTGSQECFSLVGSLWRMSENKCDTCSFVPSARLTDQNNRGTCLYSSILHACHLAALRLDKGYRFSVFSLQVLIFKTRDSINGQLKKPVVLHMIKPKTDKFLLFFPPMFPATLKCQ